MYLVLDGVIILQYYINIFNSVDRFQVIGV